jgi:hypothetical protein
MPNQLSGGGAPFLERVLRAGNKRNSLLGMPAPGGTNVPTPGVGRAPMPSNLEPSQERGPRPEERQPRPQPTPQGGGQPQQQSQPEQPIPSLDEELPSTTLADADGGEVFPASSLGERFYRRYGRNPTDVDYHLLHMREQFEQFYGRAPTKTELMSSIRRQYEVREDRFV